MENYSACLTFYQLNMLVKPYMMVQKGQKQEKKFQYAKPAKKERTNPFFVFIMERTNGGNKLYVKY